MRKLFLYLLVGIFSLNIFTTSIYASNDLWDLENLMSTLENNGPFSEIYKNPSIWQKYGQDLKRKSYNLFNKVDHIGNKLVNKRVNGCYYINSSNIAILKQYLSKCEDSLSSLNNLEKWIQELAEKYKTKKIFQKGNLWYSMLWYLYYKTYLAKKNILIKISSIKKQISKLSEEDDIVNVLNELDQTTNNWNNNYYNNKEEIINFFKSVISKWYIRNWNENTKQIKLLSLWHGYNLKWKLDQIDIECSSNNLKYPDNMLSYNYKMLEYTYSWGPVRNIVIGWHWNDTKQYNIIKRFDPNKYNSFVLDMSGWLKNYIRNRNIDTVINCTVRKVIYKGISYNINYKFYPITISKEIYNKDMFVWCLSKVHPSWNISSPKNKIYLVKYEYKNNKITKTYSKEIWTFVNKPNLYSITYQYNPKPIKWYDRKALFKWKWYYWLTEASCMYPSKNILELSNKLSKDTNIWRMADNLYSSKLDRNDNFWVLFKPKKSLGWYIKSLYYR